jgi:quinohemoprotein ethanol dehydrogenase
MKANGGSVRHMEGFFTSDGLIPDDTYDAAATQRIYGTLPSTASLRTERHGQNLVREILKAWDPVARRVVWQQTTSETNRGYDGGVLTTAGNLLFQGRGDGKLYVYAADTGKILKVLDTGSHIMAAPMSYEVGGTQYIAVQTGYGGAGISVGPFPPNSAARTYDNENRIVAFKLDGGSVPMPALRPNEPFPPPPASTAGAAEISRGEVKFAEQCSRCHVFGPSVTPDLRKLPPAAHAAFEAIVLKGVLGAAGMERFDDLLSDADVKAIHAYLIDQQRQGYLAQEKTKFK